MHLPAEVRIESAASVDAEGQATALAEEAIAADGRVPSWTDAKRSLQCRRCLEMYERRGQCDKKPVVRCGRRMDLNLLLD